MDRLLLLLMVLLLSACSGPLPLPSTTSVEGNDRPEWLESLPQQPDALYSVASVKLAGSQASAEQQARQQAVRQLELQLQSRVQDSGSASHQQNSSDLQREIHRRTPLIDLTAVEPIASYCDVGEGQVYALARLDVAQEVASAKRKVETLNHEIQRYAASVRANEGQVLKKVQGITKTLQALEQRQQLHVLVKTLQPEGEGVPLTQPLLDIQQQILQGVEQTPISISPLSGAGVDVTISQVLTQQLLQRGLVVAAGTGKLQLQYRLKQVNRFHDETFFVTIDGLIQLNDHTGKNLMSLKVLGEGRHAIEDKAIRQALAELGDHAASKVVEVLFDVAG